LSHLKESWDTMFKIIIVDDNALSVKGLIANVNFSSLDAKMIASFYNGIDVMTYLQEHPDVDIVVSDIRMPNMTGLELAKEALKINRLIKIILISAYDDFEYAQEALRIGVFDYVQKPIQYDSLTKIIQRALVKTTDERRILKQLEEAQPLLLEKFYTDLLHSHPLLVENILKQRADYLNVPTNGGAFICLAITGESDEQANVELGVEQDLLFMISRIKEMRGYFGALFSCHLVSERDIILAICHSPDLVGDEMLCKVVELCKAYNTVQDEHQLRICFGIGPAVNTLWEISRSMDAAVRAVNRRYILLGETIFVEKPDELSKFNFVSHLSESETEIVKLLLQRNTQELSRVTQMLVESYPANLADGVTVISFINVLVTGILRQFSHESFELSRATKLLTSFNSRKHHVMNDKQVSDFLMSFFTSIMQELVESQQSHQKTLIMNVKKYIDDHLHDPQLRLESIASYVHLNQFHLSRIFKKSESVNVSDYITDHRIIRAEKLLLTTNEPVSLISEQVGYASPYYFSACFKRITGSTPSEYRKNIVSS
jgi:two-component system, response regulator YesN